MKQLIAIPLMLLALIGNTQENVSLAIYQDLGLAVRSDDYGNNPFTIDVTMKFLMNGNHLLSYKGNFIGYTHMGAIVEIADLAGGNYTRYGAELGFTFTHIYIGNLRTEITPLVNYGFLERTHHVESYNGQGAYNPTFTVRAWEFGLQYGIPLSPHIKLLALGTITQANDLQVLWGDDAKKWRKNFSIGIEIAFTKPTIHK